MILNPCSTLAVPDPSAQPRERSRSGSRRRSVKMPQLPANLAAEVQHRECQANHTSNTHIAACVGALVWMLTEHLNLGKPTGIGWATGAIAGLATITPAAVFISPGAAMVHLGRHEGHDSNVGKQDCNLGTI